MYKEFIKSEYKRLFGKNEYSYKPKYKIGDKIKVSRMAGNGIATIIGMTKFAFNEPAYITKITWNDKDRVSELQEQCRAFDEQEGIWKKKKKNW